MIPSRVAAFLVLGCLAPAHAGVLIERVMPQSAGAMAGLRAGDEIISLSPAPGQVEQLDSPVDLFRADLSYSYRSPVTVTVIASGKTVTRTIPTGTWGIHVRPTAPVADERDAPIAAIMRGAIAFEQWDLDRAREEWAQAESLLGTAPSAQWLRAQILVRLGAAATLKGDLARAQEFLDEALQIQTGLAPGSLAVADTKRALATVHHERREIDAARALLQEALALVDPMPRNNLVWVEIQLKLAHIEKLVGPLGSAAPDLSAAYQLAKALQPQSILVSRLLTTLGTRALDAGDIALAEELIGQALAMAREVAPGTIAEAGNLMNLGSVRLRRHDYAAAQREYEQAAAIFERISPDSPAALRALSNVAMAAGAADAPQQAVAVLERVLTIQQRTQPDSLDSAQTYNALGLNYQRLRESQRALHAFERALAIKERLSPNSMTTGIAHENLGMALRGVGQLDAAARSHRLALAIFRQMPGTVHEAESLHSLGLVERERDRAAALQYFSQAIHAIEQQEKRLGGSREVRAGFAAYYGTFYKDYLELLLQAGREEDAFQALERYRARVLAAMEAERRASVDPANRRGPVITARDVSANLPRGSVLLSYSVGEADLKIFAVRSSQDLKDKNAPTLRVLKVPVSAAQLQQEIAAWRDLLRSPAAARPGSREAQELSERGHRLRKWLLDVADESLAGSDHWIVVADGPLHLLPLTALPAAADAGPGIGYVAQRVRVTTAISATLLLAGSPLPAGAARVLALGDPAYPQSDRPQLRRLEGTQVELRSIRRIYGEDARIYSGPEATERRAQAIPPQTRYVHYAVHGVLDDRAPFDSYLAFVPERDPAPERTLPTPSDRDGRLQAWEIAASMHLAAELVVLSACDTALGMDAAGEGLMGLTRAFQYAGAGAVLASLWEAPDRSTSMFMAELHRRLHAGEPVEHALQATQRRFISDPAFRIWSHPLHWAGFQVSAARPRSL